MKTTIKKPLAALLSIILILSANVPTGKVRSLLDELFFENAYASTDFSDGDFKYVVNSQDETAIIVQFNPEITDSIIVPNVLCGYKVSAINDYAFRECQIRSVKISDGITHIGRQAFSACKNLRRVEIPDSVVSLDEVGQIFSGCSMLEEVTLSKNITTIPLGMFRECVNLENIDLHEGITTIGESAFEGSGLTNIEFPTSVTSIECEAFAECNSLTEVIIPDTVTAVSYWAFKKCENLKDVEIGVAASVASDAFQFCSNLEKYSVNEQNNFLSSMEGVLYNKDKTKLLHYPANKRGESFTVPESVTYIEECAFYGTKRLMNITIPEGVERIMDSAFACSEKLETTRIPKSLLYYGTSLFQNCVSLSNVTLLQTLTYIQPSTFSFCEKLVEVSIPDEVETIGTGAFRNCKDLKKVTLPSSLTEIGWAAFFECEALTEILIPQGTTTILANAFEGCSNLKVVIMPSSVKTVDISAFGLCESLSDVYYEGTEEQWRAIDNVTTDFWNNVTIHYNYDYSIFPDTPTTQPVPTTTKPATEPTEPATKPTEPSTTPSVPSTTVPSTEDESNNKYGLFTYRIVNGEAEIISCDSGATGKVIIPSEIEGCPVTVLGNKSFYQCSDISNLIIPDTVKKIGDYAFNCGFESVMIPESVTEIGYRAFQDCWNIKKINIDENNKNYSSDEYGVLFNKDKTELIYFPCLNKKTSYDIPESVVKIWESAFFCALDLEYVYISKNVSDIQIFQFTCCYNLKGIIVDEKNEAYSCDKNGVLFNKDKTVLIRYPLGSEETKYTIPESVTEFEIDAFSEAVNLESVVIPEGVEEIGYCTFADCHKLKSVILPEGIRVIGDQAFVFCESLENIYIPYGAAKIEWLAFRGCTSLEYVHIPETVGYIGETILLETDNVYICSYTEDCYAKMYAEDNGYEFRLCDNHGSPIPEPTTQPVPTTTQTMPSSTQPAPTTTQSVPTTTQSVPTTTQSVPTTTQSVPTTTQPMPTTTQPEPTTNKDVTVTDPDNSDISPELFDKDLIRTPSTTVIKYADSIILHADLKNYPAGSKVEWSMNNGNFEIVDISEDSLTCVITPKSNGDAVFTAIVYGEDGEVLGTDTQKMTSKAGFFNKIFGFFRRIFGLTKIIPNAIKFAF